MLNALIAKVLETLFSWIWRKRKVCVPLEDNFFITKSAVEISDMIRTRKVTAHHVVQAYTTRLADVSEKCSYIVIILRNKIRLLLSYLIVVGR